MEDATTRGEERGSLAKHTPWSAYVTPLYVHHLLNEQLNSCNLLTWEDFDGLRQCAPELG